MRWTNLAILSLIMMAIGAAICSTDEDTISFEEYTLSIGDRVDIGDYRVELVDIQSVRDGLTVVRVSERNGDFDEQRVLLENSDNKFNGGSEEGGLTITVTEIFDEQSAKLRLEYPESLGTPRKRLSDRPAAAKAAPNLAVEKSFDVDRISVGDSIKVTVMVTNLGLDTADDVEVSDTLLSEFGSFIGYPPKIKSQLGPGESDSAIYVMTALKEGLVKVPSIEVRYLDSKGNVKSNRSEGFEIIISPARAPVLEIKIDQVPPLKPGLKAAMNITVSNVGQAAASSVEIKSDIRPAEGIDVSGLDRTFFEIPAGGQESYTALVEGKSSGNYTINLEASYRSGTALTVTKSSTELMVLEQEYKYLYYLLILPFMLIAYRIYKRYKEYKY